ncbi:unnamed protein product, partial [Staurois parvus]
MVGMDLVQTGTRSRPLRASSCGREHRQGSAGMESDGKRQADLLLVIRAGWMDRRVSKRSQGSTVQQFAGSAVPGIRQKNRQASQGSISRIRSGTSRDWQ